MLPATFIALPLVIDELVYFCPDLGVNGIEGNRVSFPTSYFCSRSIFSGRRRPLVLMHLITFGNSSFNTLNVSKVSSFARGSPGPCNPYDLDIGKFLQGITHQPDRFLCIENF